MKNTKLTDAYDLGWFDAYDDLPYCNPYDKESEPELWQAYEDGYKDGDNDA